MGCIKYHLVQISKDGDRADAQWPLRTCSGPEVLNQPLLPFIKKTFRKICFNGFSKLLTRITLFPGFGLPWLQELFWLPTSESEEP
jgi:hypothetical protein